MRRLAMSLLALALGGSVLAGPARGAAHSASQPNDVDIGRLIFSLPVGDPIRYEGGPEQLVWGPAGIAVDDRGGIWIADGVDHRALRFDRFGSVTATVELREVVGIGEIAIFGEALIVLDIAAVSPGVYVYNVNDGRLRHRFDVPRWAGLMEGLSGLSVMPDGTVAVELEGGLRVVTVGTLGDSPGAPLAAVSETRLTLSGAVRVEPSIGPLPLERTLQIGDVGVTLTGTNPIGTVMVAGSSDEAVYVLVDESGQQPDGAIVVDTTLRVFDPAGRPLGLARVPRAEMAVQLFRPVAISAGGEILALVPKESSIDVVALTLSDSLDAVLEPDQPVLDSGSIGIESCLSRSEMLGIAQEYALAMAWLSDTNINGPCTGRTKPRYLGGPDSYISVPYKWGGWSTVASYKYYMDPRTGRAGDIDSASGTLSCAHGVDCSGYVSRVWRLSTKHSTSTLNNVSYVIPKASLVSMDIFLKSGHVMLYRSVSGNGYNVAESTTASSLDRVVFRWVTDSYANQFTPRRYNSVCN